MNTPTHLLISTAALGQPNKFERNTAVLTGALVPDLAIYTLWSSARVTGYSEQSIWETLYELPIWQDAVALGNSILLYVGLLTIAYFIFKKTKFKIWSRLLAIACLSALLHLAFDFPFHADDAHAHFWPLSDWRFHSPLSYWDPTHYGNVVSMVEIAGAIVLTVIIWRRFKSRWVRGLLAFNLCLYVLVPTYFTLILG